MYFQNVVNPEDTNRLEYYWLKGGANNAIVEGNYGVIRNHWYVLTVNKLVRLGTGVFDLEEVIVTPVEPEDPTYYMGARINILSWKIVTQKVEL